MKIIECGARRARGGVRLSIVVTALVGLGVAGTRSAESAETRDAARSAVARGAPESSARGIVMRAGSAGDPAEALPAAMTIYLHGMCGTPAHGCDRFRAQSPGPAWLVCPAAPSPCAGGGARWSGSLAARSNAVSDAERRLLAEHPGEVDAARPRVLIGFSEGAYVARDLILAQPGRYRGALFIGADVRLPAAALRRAGVARVAFASGRLDMMRSRLEGADAALKREGFPSRFVDLGRVGHTYVPADDDDDALREALAWLSAGGDV